MSENEKKQEKASKKLETIQREMDENEVNEHEDAQADMRSPVSFNTKVSV
jgi:hypothetical protein